MAENTQQNTVKNASAATTRSDFIQRTIDRKKRVVEQNYNAQIFISDSIAGQEIFSKLRMIDAMDSNIRRLWGHGVDSKDTEKWVKDIVELNKKIDELEAYGREILAKVGNVRDIQDRYLRRSINETIQKSKETDKQSSKDKPKEATKK